MDFVFLGRLPVECPGTAGVGEPRRDWIASRTVESGLRLLQFLPPFPRLIRLAPSVVLLNQAAPSRIDEALARSVGSWFFWPSELFADSEIPR